MLRLAFWSLLILNIALFAYAQGLLGSARSIEHEPARLKRQFNTAKMALLTREQAEAAAKAAPAPGTDAASADAQAGAPAAPAPAAPAAPAPTAAAPAYACTEIGPFDSGDARRFEARLAGLELGERRTRQAIPAQDVTSWLVNIPPQGSREGAERKAAELRNLGISDFYIMNGDSPLRNAISLGAFKTETGAQNLLAQLGKQGVHTARITPRGPQSMHYVYRVRALDAATRKRIAGWAERYDGAALKDCS